MPNPSKPTKNLSKFDIRLLVMALILAAVGLVIFAVVGVFVNFKSKELRTQWLSRSPIGQVVNVIPAGGSGWWASATLIQTNLGYFSVRGGIALRNAETLNLVELGDHSRLLCDAVNHCMAVDERLELAPKEKVQ
jgi:heme/copper-type cytochrome/quinol oxidase subunit 2